MGTKRWRRNTRPLPRRPRLSSRGGGGCLGAVVLRGQFRRNRIEAFFSALPRVEACGGVHYWARLVERHGHNVRIMPPAYVKPWAPAVTELRRRIPVLPRVH